MRAKYLYSPTSDIRAKITKGKSICGYPQLTIKLQCRVWWGWKNIQHLDIELKEYWTVLGGIHGTERPLTFNYMYGGELEVWYPEHFNLEKRVNELFTTYYNQRKAILKAERRADENMLR